MEAFIFDSGILLTSSLNNSHICHKDTHSSNDKYNL